MHKSNCKIYQNILCNQSVIRNRTKSCETAHNKSTPYQYAHFQGWKRSDLMTGNLCYTICRPRTILLKFDFKQGYHSTDIHSEFTKYLAFCWEGEFYVILVLPFGLSLAPSTFTKMKKMYSETIKITSSQGCMFPTYWHDHWNKL